MRFFTLALLWFSTLSAAGGDDLTPRPLTPFTARYAVRHAGLPLGTLEQSLSYPRPGEYRFSSLLVSSGIARLLRKLRMEEISEGVLRGQAFEPRRYTSMRISGSRRRSEEVVFDTASGALRVTRNALAVSLPLRPGILDKLAWQLSLMQALQAGERTRKFTVAADGKLKTYQPRPSGEERLDIAGTPVSTLRMVHARAGSRRRTTFWCDPSREFLPVRIEYVEDDGGVTVATLIGPP